LATEGNPKTAFGGAHALAGVEYIEGEFLAITNALETALSGGLVIS